MMQCYHASSLYNSKTKDRFQLPQLAYQLNINQKLEA